MLTTGLNRTNTDQFYTSPSVAMSCVAMLKAVVPTTIQWVEPSAGTGVFLDLVPTAVGYDIDPKDDRIEKRNFLEVDVPQGCVVFGNPPFGRQASMAKKFIKHACEKAHWIGFILPRSFQKPSMQKAFPRCFHLVQSMDLPTDAFIVDGEPYDVPCVFQIWKREETVRVIEEIAQPSGFEFVKSSDEYSFAFRRVGVNAGKCCLPSDVSPQSHYFIRISNEKAISRVISLSQLHTFPTNTTGPRSLSKHEATEFLNYALEDAASRL